MIVRYLLHFFYFEASQSESSERVAIVFGGTDGTR